MYVCESIQYNVLFSDGIPIRAGDDIDGDDSEELKYEWSTEGEREIEPERDSPRVDQVCVCAGGALFLNMSQTFISALDTTVSSIQTSRNYNRSTLTMVSGSSRWPRSSRRATWRKNRWVGTQ